LSTRIADTGAGFKPNGPDRHAGGATSPPSLAAPLAEPLGETSAPEGELELGGGGDGVRGWEGWWSKRLTAGSLRDAVGAGGPWAGVVWVWHCAMAGPHRGHNWGLSSLAGLAGVGAAKWREGEAALEAAGLVRVWEWWERTGAGPRRRRSVRVLVAPQRNGWSVGLTGGLLARWRGGDGEHGGAGALAVLAGASALLLGEQQDPDRAGVRGLCGVGAHTAIAGLGLARGSGLLVGGGADRYAGERVMARPDTPPPSPGAERAAGRRGLAQARAALGGAAGGGGLPAPSPGLSGGAAAGPGRGRSAPGIGQGADRALYGGTQDPLVSKTFGDLLNRGFSGRNGVSVVPVRRGRGQAGCSVGGRLAKGGAQPPKAGFVVCDADRRGCWGWRSPRWATCEPCSERPQLVEFGSAVCDQCGIPALIGHPRHARWCPVAGGPGLAPPLPLQWPQPGHPAEALGLDPLGAGGAGPTPSRATPGAGAAGGAGPTPSRATPGAGAAGGAGAGGAGGRVPADVAKLDMARRVLAETEARTGVRPTTPPPATPRPEPATDPENAPATPAAGGDGGLSAEVVATGRRGLAQARAALSRPDPPASSPPDAEAL